MLTRRSFAPVLISSLSFAFRFTAVCAILVSSIAVAIGDERPLSFNRDVRAILTDKCFACHGLDAETVEGGLRLDVREEAVDATGAIVPGEPDSSEMIRRILSDDADEQMPPPELHKPLTAEEKKLLSRWVAEGAEYQPHWAYTSMKHWSPVGGVPRPRSASDRIDAIINERLRSEGIAAVEAADPITLIRRLSLDLTGLPPTQLEVDAFLKDQSIDAYANLVDRLLSSPRFGERMAVYWLDLVRYADTVGYHGDQNISQSPYRDYVINAFNENLPYDQFIKEQLAGDLLPEANLQQKIASGYNRLNQTTEEGGSQAKEYLAIYFADRVRNVSQVFMGATVGCAQCHDHKYDPYTAKDFYSLGAFFADIEERGVYGARSRPPMIRVVGEKLAAQLAMMDDEIAELQSRLPAVRKSALAEQEAWEIGTRERLHSTKEIEIAWVDDSIRVAGKARETWKFVSGDEFPIKSGTQSRLQQSKGLVQHLVDINEKELSVGKDEVFYAWIYLDPSNPPNAVMLQINDGDWSHRKVWGSDEIPYGRSPQSTHAYQRAGKLPETGTWVRLEVTLEEIGLKPGVNVKGIAFTQFGGLAYWDKAGVVESQGVPEPVAQALLTTRQERSAEQSQTLKDYYLRQSPAVVALNSQIEGKKAARKAAYESAPQTVVSKSVKPRTIRILPRGNWMDDSGPIVEPAIPEFLGALNTDQTRPSRLDLANWLCEDNNPLTARTMANRMWSLMFGRGICSSVDDFGGQGTYPSYPELLDDLSLEFIESGWDLKQLLRAIALSQAYQRSSTPTDSLRQADPYNDLFARQGRFCVDAEVVRDLALSASGLLVEKIGGPSVRPYQPAGYYAQLNFPRRKYVADGGDSQYRRGLYTHWQRTFLHPMLKAFDAPSREECTAQRSRSNTPLQALVLLNDPTFVEAARAFAERIVSEGGQSPEERVQWAYQTVVSRRPGEAISNELQLVFESHLKQFQADPERAAKAVGQGRSPKASHVDSPTLAAWTSVARVILNLHETITRY